MSFADSTTRILNRLYTSFGVTLIFASPYDGSPVVLTAIDRTAGVEFPERKMEIATFRPAADIRRVDLDSRSIRPSDMEGVAILLNGKPWTVKSVAPRPVPGGQSPGEIRLILSDNT
jgi:hypothetical protein